MENKIKVDISSKRLEALTFAGVRQEMYSDAYRFLRRFAGGSLRISSTQELRYKVTFQKTNVHCRDVVATITYRSWWIRRTKKVQFCTYHLTTTLNPAYDLGKDFTDFRKLYADNFEGKVLYFDKA